MQTPLRDKKRLVGLDQVQPKHTRGRRSSAAEQERSKRAPSGRATDNLPGLRLRAGSVVQRSRRSPLPPPAKLQFGPRPHTHTDSHAEVGRAALQIKRPAASRKQRQINPRTAWCGPHGKSRYIITLPRVTVIEVPKFKVAFL